MTCCAENSRQLIPLFSHLKRFWGILSLTFLKICYNFLHCSLSQQLIDLQENLQPKGYTCYCRKPFKTYLSWASIFLNLIMFISCFWQIIMLWGKSSLISGFLLKILLHDFLYTYSRPEHYHQLLPYRVLEFVVMSPKSWGDNKVEYYWNSGLYID